MKRIKWALLKSVQSIILVVFFSFAYPLQCIDNYNRYYFASYDELIEFFEKPNLAASSFSHQQTEFYADVYHKKTLDQAVTACVYRNAAKGTEHYASHVVTYIDPKTKQRYEVPARSLNTAFYQSNQTSKQNQESLSHWKIVAPDGQEHNSAEYEKNPDKFNGLWNLFAPVMPAVTGIPYSAEIVQGSNGRNSLQISIGDQDVCQNARTTSQRMDDYHRAAVQEYKRKMELPLNIGFKEIHDHHQKCMERCENFLERHERDILREKKELLLSLWPPVSSTPPLHDNAEACRYNQAIKTMGWLAGEIKKLDQAFAERYGWGIFTTPHDMHKFKDMYLPTVDRIAQEFYKRYPALKPKEFKAIRLSHAIAFHHYDDPTLTKLSDQWNSDMDPFTRQNDRYQQRMRALQNVKKSKGLMRDYSAHIKKHAPFADEYADVFNNRYGTALDQQLHEELCQTRVHMIDLVNNNPSSKYPGFYAPIVNRCTARAKQERNIDTAFSLSDYSDALIRIVSKGIHIIETGLRSIGKGQQLVAEYEQREQLTPEDIRLMKDVLGGSAHGLVDAAETVLTPEHWSELVMGVPILVFQTLVVLGKMEDQGERLLLALFDSDPNAFGMEFQRLCDKTQQKTQLIQQTFEQTIAKMATLSVYDCARHASCLGATVVLDCVAMHGLSLAASSAGRKFVSKTATLFESAKAEEVMAEVAGIGKIAVEEGVEVASRTVELPSKNCLISKQTSKLFVLTPEELRLIDSYGLKLIGENTWQSPRGLIYESGSKHGHRITHLLEHSVPNPNKINHTIFNVSKDEILPLVDEAWFLRKLTMPVLQSNGNESYIIPMGRRIGTNGETCIQIIVKSGTSKIATAFPIK